MQSNVINCPGCFTGHPDENILMTMYNTITELKLWNWLSEYFPEEKKGFMFSSAPEIQEIIHHDPNASIHSGASFAICLREMEYIAKNGWNNYCKNNSYFHNKMNNV
jgi:hypothetical protein